MCIRDSFPEMGIAGAALATGIGQLVPVVFYLIVYNVRPIPVKLRRACPVSYTHLDVYKRQLQAV